MPIETRPARKTDVAAIARVLGLAFHDDPVICWLQPNPGKRRAALPGFFGALARHHFLAGGGVELPFGGVKSSGYGREKGFEALHGFTTLKTVAFKHD